jgi:hypothetical protein
LFLCVCFFFWQSGRSPWLHVYPTHLIKASRRLFHAQCFHVVCLKLFCHSLLSACMCSSISDCYWVIVASVVSFFSHFSTSPIVSASCWSLASRKCELMQSLVDLLLWSSYDHIRFSNSSKQEIFILMLNLLQTKASS